MKDSEVPQDENSTFAGERKAMYALDASGHYSRVASTGWDVEETATRLALEDMQRAATEALARVRAGRSSPLEFHMYERRMDVQTLSQATGIWRWRIRRHFRPAVFKRLKVSLLERYADAMGMDIDSLKRVPDRTGTST